MWWLFAAIMALALVATILASSLRVSVDYRRCGEDDRFAITISWLKILKLKFTMRSVRLQVLFSGRQTILQVTLKTPRAAEEKQLVLPILLLLRRILHLLTRYRKALLYAIRRTRIHELVWYTMIGAREADKTGFLSGLIWSAKAFLFATATRYVRFSRPPSFKVQPDFRTPGTATKLRCTFDIRLGHVVLAGLKVLRPQRW